MTDKVYMPLSGEEVCEVIFRKGKGAASKFNQYFGAHVAYHNPRIQLAIKVDCHTPEGAPDTGGFELVVPLGGTIFEPDRAREEVGLGTYETKLVDEKSGTLADVKTLDTAAVVEKVNRIMAANVDEREAMEKKELDEKGKRAKPKKLKNRRGWPKGKPRGPKVAA